MRRSTIIAALGTLIPGLALAGEPVLLPDFAPGSTSDFSLASMLQESTASVLSRAGHVVLLDAVVEPVVGTLFGCADEPTCPHAQLQKLPARFAVVVAVRREGDTIMADIELFERSSQAPIERRTVRVVDGQEDDLGREISDLVSELASVMGPADASSLIAAARLISQAEEAAGDGDDAQSSGAAPDDAAAPGQGDASRTRERPTKPEPLSDQARIEQALEDAELMDRHLEGVRQHFLDSELDIRDWLYRNTPHAGRTIIEVRGGYGFGDTDRVAYVRTALNGEQQDRWFQEGPAPGQRVRGELFIGYAPSAWVDIGALLGLQYGERTLSSGWVDEGGADSPPPETDVVQAVQFHLQPRVRLYPVRTGPVKPYLFGGVDLRFFDQWRIRQPDNIGYASPPGGFAVGPAGGLGLLVDPSPIVGFFVEGCGLTHVTSRGGYVQNDSQIRPADAETFITKEPAGYLVVISAGVQFRL